MTRTGGSLARWTRRLGVRRVRVRITAAATLAAGIAAILGSAVFVLSLHETLEESLISSATQQVQTVRAQLVRGSSPAGAVVTGREDVVTQIVSSAGQVIASDHAVLTTPVRIRAGTWDNVRVAHLHDTYVLVARRAPTGDLIVVGRSEEQVQRATATVTTFLAVSLPVLLALFALVVWMSTGRALRPVEVMRREASAITSEHLHRRLPSPEGSDEFARLARTLNEMLDRIDASSKLQRQFVSDASHELRSPLAAIRQLTEVARRYPDRADAGKLAVDVQAEERRMEQMVAALLTLARLENSAQAPARVLVDLDEIVLEQVVRSRESGGGPRVEVGRVDAAQVRGNEALVAQVVHNLLSNARRHAREWVHLSLSVSGTSCVLVVDDDGNGVAADSRLLIFERFARLDEARARDEGGSGLGLAIVHKVVDDLGGTVTVEDSPAGGARFVVSLPLAQDDSRATSEFRSATRA